MDGILIIFAFIGAVVSAVVASGKHRNPVGYGALGFFLPLIGVIAICCLPALKPEGAGPG